MASIERSGSGRGVMGQKGGEMRRENFEEGVVQILNGGFNHEDLLGREKKCDNMIILYDLIAKHIKLNKMKKVMLRCQQER